MTDKGRTRTVAEREATRYWAEQMQRGAEFTGRACAHPLHDEGGTLVDIRGAAAERGIEIEFSGSPHPSGQARIFSARPAVVEGLLAAAAELRAGRHTLLIEDGFRTEEMQRELALGELILDKLLAAIRRLEPDASPEMILARLAVVVQVRAKSAGHMAGAALDVSVLGPDGMSLDRGGPVPTVSEVMPMDSTFISASAEANRRFVSEVMGRHGFVPYPFEFWHYSRDDVLARVAAGDPRPAIYGPVRLGEDGQITPLEDPLTPLHSSEELERGLAAALRRASDGAADAAPSA